MRFPILESFLLEHGHSRHFKLCMKTALTWGSVSFWIIILSSWSLHWAEWLHPPPPPHSGPVVPNNVTSFGNKVFADMITDCAKVIVITGGPKPGECPEEGQRRQTDKVLCRQTEPGVQGPSEAGGDAEGSLLEPQRQAVPWHPDF